MQRTIITTLLFLHFSILYCQNRHDFNWILGYDTSDIIQGGNAILLNFNNNPVIVSSIITVNNYDCGGASSIMSDSSGNLLFYSNGCYVINANHQEMINGDSINPGFIQQYYCKPGGYSPNYNGSITIPWPESPNLYLLFVTDYKSVFFPDGSFGRTAAHVYYNVIDMSKGNGQGAVVQKNSIAIADTLCINGLKACRHANGRDWWVCVPVPRSNCYYMVPVTPEGVQPPQMTCAGLVPWNDMDLDGEALFTPDGKKFIRFNVWNSINIFDFDASTGQLSNQQKIPVDSIVSYSAGMAISPNSRFLYITLFNRIFQYDLWAPDIASSRILIAWYDNVPDPFVPSAFVRAALAADGKIYISSVSSHKSLHIIHRPDCEGLYSLPEVRGLHLPSYNYDCMTNVPFYRNQPSTAPCDSVAVDVHFPEDGANDVVIFPNPCHNTVNVMVNHPLTGLTKWVLWNWVGAKIREVQLDDQNENHEIDLHDAAPGIYYYCVFSNGHIVYQGKIIKI